MLKDCCQIHSADILSSKTKLRWGSPIVFQIYKLKLFYQQVFAQDMELVLVNFTWNQLTMGAGGIYGVEDRKDHDMVIWKPSKKISPKYLLTMKGIYNGEGSNTST